MKKISKKIALFLAAISMFSVTACRDEESEESSSSVGPINVNTQTIIAKDGKSNYTIVIPTNATETEQYAGEVLSNYLKQMTGASIRVVREEKISDISTEMKLISVGETDLMAAAGLDYTSVDFNVDGFIQKTVDNTLFLCGGDSDRSDLYAVYDYLESCLGAKFFAIDCEVIPTHETVYLPNLNVVDVPTFAYRASVNNALEDPDFQGKARMMGYNLNYADKYGESYGDYVWGSQHNIAATVIPYNTWRISHPEWYYTTSNGSVNFNPACGINDEGKYDNTLEVNPVDVAVNTYKNALLNTNCYYLNCSYADTGSEPPASTESGLKYMERVKKYKASGVLIQFLNAVCEKLDEWIATGTDEQGNLLFPNGRAYSILNLEYIITRHAPIDAVTGELLVEAHKNIAHWDAPIQLNTLYSICDSRQDDDAKNQVTSWAKVSDNHAIWDYFDHYQSYGLYYMPFIQTVQETYQHYEQNGVSYVFMQAAGWEREPQAAQSALKAYVASKLMWDPYRYNVMDLVEEFCVAYYGDYAEDVLTVMNMLEDNFAVLQNGAQRVRLDHSKINWAAYHPLRMLTNGINVLDQALEKNRNSNATAEEKALLAKRIELFETSLYAMIVMEYSTYFQGDMTDFGTYSDKFFSLLETSGWWTALYRTGSGKNIGDYMVATWKNKG